jgi:hypothetical protein
MHFNIKNAYIRNGCKSMQLINIGGWVKSQKWRPWSGLLQEYEFVLNLPTWGNNTNRYQEATSNQWG